MYINISSLALPAMGILFISSIALLLSNDWRVSIAALGFQYLGVFILVSLRWPADMAVTKLVAGWMAGAILGLSYFNRPRKVSAPMVWPSFRLFRIFAAALIVLIVVSIAPQALNWIPGIDLPQMIGALVLIGMGLLHLGLTSQPLRVVLGLLTVLSGFEIIYAAVENSALVAGLLGGITLGMATVGAYLLVTVDIEANT